LKEKKANNYAACTKDTFVENWGVEQLGKRRMSCRKFRSSSSTLIRMGKRGHKRGQWDLPFPTKALADSSGFCDAFKKKVHSA